MLEMNQTDAIVRNCNLRNAFAGFVERVVLAIAYTCDVTFVGAAMTRESFC
jgi:hypothetical protein